MKLLPRRVLARLTFMTLAWAAPTLDALHGTAWAGAQGAGPAAAKPSGGNGSTKGGGGAKDGSGAKGGGGAKDGGGAKGGGGAKDGGGAKGGGGAKDGGGAKGGGGAKDGGGGKGGGGAKDGGGGAKDGGGGAKDGGSDKGSGAHPANGAIKTGGGAKDTASGTKASGGTKDEGAGAKGGGAPIERIGGGTKGAGDNGATGPGHSAEARPQAAAGATGGASNPPRGGHEGQVSPVDPRSTPSAAPSNIRKPTPDAGRTGSEPPAAAPGMSSGRPAGTTPLATPAVTRPPQSPSRSAGTPTRMTGPVDPSHRSAMTQPRGGKTVPIGGVSLWVTESPRKVGGPAGALLSTAAPHTTDAPPITAHLAALEAGMATRTIGDARLPAFHDIDPRTARPSPVRRLTHPEAGAPPPTKHSYVPRYTQWWIYPWWRYQSSTTVIVVLPGVLFPWMMGWVGPQRDGYAWIEGSMLAGTWWPGSYAPTLPAPEFLGVPYVWVEGYWIGERYVEGFWRPERRLDGDWHWVDGAYDAAGLYHPGAWEPAAPWPDGMTWEPGFFDGQQWVEGFFRPATRDGFVWVEARIDPATGARHNGHWLPIQDRPQMVWVPGWFDGRAWIEQGWVAADTIRAGVPADWKPADGAEPNGGPAVAEPELAPRDAQPLAVPVP